LSTAKKKEKFLIYKGFPLVRCGDIIYYGNMTDKYIIMMQVLEKKKLEDLEIATKILIQLQYTDPDVKARERIIKQSEKKGLYAAIDVSAVWLERALAGKI